MAGSASDFLEVDVAELTRESRLLFGLRPNDVDVFEARLPIQSQIHEVLSEKTEALAKEENCDQCQYEDGDERVAPEESAYSQFGSSPSVSSRAFSGRNRQLLRDCFHTGDDAKAPEYRQWFLMLRFCDSRVIFIAKGATFISEPGVTPQDSSKSKKHQR
jgi:hypothetical protein